VRKEIKKLPHVAGRHDQIDVTSSADVGCDLFFFRPARKQLKDGCTDGVEAKYFAFMKIENDASIGVGYGSQVFG
jgi:hypothetical protein